MEHKSDGNMMAVPFVAYEAAEARSERRNRRLVIVLVITIFLMFISNALWLYEWTSYDYTSSETLVEAADGIANYHSDNNYNGDINYGTDISENNSTP